MAAPDTWSETALVAITEVGGTDINFQTITETADINFGDKNFDAIANLAGGRLVKFNPQDVAEVTLEMYPQEAGTDTGVTGKGVFDLLQSGALQDTTQPLSIAVARARTKSRVVILWTDDTSVTSAVSAVNLNQTGLRLVLKNGYFVSANPSFTDGVLKWTVMFRCPAFDKTGSANITVESADGTATMTAVAAYT